MSRTEKRLKRFERLKLQALRKAVDDEYQHSVLAFDWKKRQINMLKNDLHWAQWAANRPLEPKEVCRSSKVLSWSSRLGLIGRDMAIVLAFMSLCAFMGWQQSYPKAYAHAVIMGEQNAARLSIEQSKIWNQYVRYIAGQ